MGKIKSPDRQAANQKITKITFIKNYFCHFFLCSLMAKENREKIWRLPIQAVWILKKVQEANNKKSIIIVIWHYVIPHYYYPFKCIFYSF